MPRHISQRDTISDNKTSIFVYSLRWKRNQLSPNLISSDLTSVNQVPSFGTCCGGLGVISGGQALFLLYQEGDLNPFSAQKHPAYVFLYRQDNYEMLIRIQSSTLRVDYFVILCPNTIKILCIGIIIQTPLHVLFGI